MTEVTTDIFETVLRPNLARAKAELGVEVDDDKLIAWIRKLPGAVGDFQHLVVNNGISDPKGGPRLAYTMDNLRPELMSGFGFTEAHKLLLLDGKPIIVVPNFLLESEPREATVSLAKVKGVFRTDPERRANGRKIEIEAVPLLRYLEQPSHAISITPPTSEHKESWYMSEYNTYASQQPFLDNYGIRLVYGQYPMGSNMGSGTPQK